ncbi:MAG: NUDIX hydrolase [bacterium]|nr:NUDIX hydrolase [Acidimicrobiia bacterium]MCY4650538.1 NUDIX hydrolase [bacterium]
MREVIKAAGGVVFRFSPHGEPQVLVIHRPRYDDWSLPKGKNDPGESSQAAALREVWEETGYRCRVIAQLGQHEYISLQGWKEVDYYAMTSWSFTGFRAGAEVDEIRWIPISETGLLSYHYDRQLVRSVDYATLHSTRTLFVVRHAVAGSRQRWSDPDHIRPLTRKGWRQAYALADRLAPEGIERLLSSPYVRCMQTLEPLGELLGLPVEEHPALAEGRGMRATMELFEELKETNAALSSHGDIIPSAILRLSETGTALSDPIYFCKKGSIWAVNVIGGTPVSAHYEPPPRV